MKSQPLVKFNDSFRFRQARCDKTIMPGLTYFELKNYKENTMINYFALHPATFKLDGGAMFGIIPRPMWSKLMPPDEENRILMSLRVMLIQTKNKNILIDCGIGDYHDQKFNQRFAVDCQTNHFEKILAEINITPNSISDIVLTHLHFDHVGGLGQLNGEQFEPIFKNATIHLNAQHFAYAQNPTARDSGSFQANYFLPMIRYYQDNNLVHWLDQNQKNILSDEDYQLKYIESNGHTPHQIHPYDNKFIYLADILPTSHHLKIPWVMGYDINPGQSTKDKEQIYAFVEANDLTIIFEHDPEFWGGKMKQHTWQKLFPVSNQIGIQKLAF